MMKRRRAFCVLQLAKTRMETLRKFRRWLDAGKIAKQHEGPANRRVMSCAVFTFRDVTRHPDKLDSGERVVDEGKMIVLKLAAIHVVGSGVRIPVPTLRVLVPPDFITLV